jgi:predicted nuclease of predicted toxin-antitoxin system
VTLLFDQNLSPLLCKALTDCFPSAFHVRDVGLREATDNAIWTYAAEHGFAIVTKDADFRQRSFLEGYPPKILWIRLGNCSSKAIEALIRSRLSEIDEFLADPQKSFLVLSRIQ